MYLLITVITLGCLNTDFTNISKLPEQFEEYKLTCDFLLVLDFLFISKYVRFEESRRKDSTALISYSLTFQPSVYYPMFLFSKKLKFQNA